MRSRPVILALAFLFLSGCGLFGSRQDPDLTVTYNPQSIGCLNDIGAKLSGYLAGTVAPADWQSSMDCAANSVDQFRQFVQPSSSLGYTSQDISAFLAKFLLTKFQDNSDIVSALLKIKAFIFGGSTQIVSFDELDRAKALLLSIRTESLKLLPLIAQRVQNPSAANLLQLSNALSVSGANVAAPLAGAAVNGNLSWDDVTNIAAAAARVLGWAEPSWLIPVTTAAKAIIFSGWSGGIESSLVPTLIETGATLGGLALAGMSLPATAGAGPNATADFYVQLALQARPTVDAILLRNGGAIPLTATDALLNALPTSALPGPASLFETASRPLVNTMLRSATKGAIDASVVNLLYQFAQDWDTSEIYLETIYDQLSEPVDTLPEAFVNTAVNFDASFASVNQALVSRLITLAQNVAPLFEGEDGQITFSAQQRLSLGQMQKLLMIRMGAEQVMLSYSSQPGKQTFAEADLQHLISDYEQIALGLHFMDATMPNIAEQRFQEADLFTMVSNGDGLLDLDEGVYFLADFYSAETLGSRIRTETQGPCGLGTYDSLDWEWMDATCFRNYFYGDYVNLWDHFPHLAEFYSVLSSADQLKFQQALEQSSRYYGYSQAPFASYDVGQLVGFMQYMETLFLRFDPNDTGALGLQEVLNGAYPVFKGTIAKLAEENATDDSVLQAILTYLLEYSEVPSKQFPAVLKFILWEAWRPFWSVNADRMAVYSVMANLSAPVSLPPVPNPVGVANAQAGH